MKFDGEIMEILAAYDLTGSLRATAELTGCSHHTVARHVAAQFGAVGIVGYVIDVGVFNLFRLDHVGQGTWASSPVGAKVVSVTVATMITWFGNRYWTFRDRRRANFVLELLEFSAIAAIGMGIAVGCLYISHYVLGYTSPPCRQRLSQRDRPWPRHGIPLPHVPILGLRGSAVRQLCRAEQDGVHARSSVGFTVGVRRTPSSGRRAHGPDLCLARRRRFPLTPW